MSLVCRDIFFSKSLNGGEPLTDQKPQQKEGKRQKKNLHQTALLWSIHCLNGPIANVAKRASLHLKVKHFSSHGFPNNCKKKQKPNIYSMTQTGLIAVNLMASQDYGPEFFVSLSEQSNISKVLVASF